MDKIYLDNAATSFPKAIGVSEEIKNYIENIGCNISRGGYTKAYDLESKVLETRELVSNFFNFNNPKNVCFTPSVTYALNFVISGILKKGDHVIISGMEHNAVSRPVNNLKDIEYSIAKCNSEGYIDIEYFKKLFKPNTKLVVISHGSNVSGSIQDIEAIGKICKEHNVYFLLDAAQSAGVVPIDFKKFNLSALAVPAHKGLLGPQGLGLLMVTDEISNEINPIVLGGTGSVSDSLDMPSFLPDKFEPGTLNLPGIMGLNAAIKYVNKIGIDKIREHELKLTKLFIDGIKDNSNIRICGPKDLNNRVGVVSLDFIRKDNSDISYELDSKYSIMTRCGLHCSPLAHKSLNTFPKGTVRFSFGYGNTEEEIKLAIKAVNELA